MPAFSGFLLVFCRIASFFVVAPVFSSRNVPNTLKIGLSFFVSLLVFAGMGAETVPLDAAYILSVIKEVLIGLALGFIGYMMLTAVQFAGSFIDMQIGFSLANVIDPMSGTASPILGNFKYTVAMLLFLTVNGHHLLLQGIMESYRLVPLNNDVFTAIYHGQVSEFVLRTFAQTLAIAFQMAAPLVSALFLTDVGLGILTRTAPQYNVFVIGVPLKILVGLSMLILLLPSMLTNFFTLFDRIMETVRQLGQLLGA